MRPLGSVCLIALCLAAPVVAHHAVSFCGTTAETAKERLFLHRQSVRRRAGLRPMAATAAAPPSINHDAGNIAIIEDSDGVVSRPNQFNLDQKTLLFTPSGTNAAQYRYSVSEQGYDSAAAQGKPLAALDDDDYRAIDLPFSFPFFGAAYNRAYVNSDGNLTSPRRNTPPPTAPWDA